MITTHVTEFVLAHSQHIPQICFCGWWQKFLNVTMGLGSIDVDGVSYTEYLKQRHHKIQHKIYKMINCLRPIFNILMLGWVQALGDNRNFYCQP